MAAILACRRQQPLTARLLGDPLPGRSALDRRAAGPDRLSAGVSVRITPTEHDPPTTDDWPDEPGDKEDPGF